MGRHADPTVPRRPAPLVLIAAGVVVLLVAGGLTWWLTASGSRCDTRQTVAVTVAPELGDVAEKLVADPVELDGGVCAVAQVTVQEPLQTVGHLTALEAEAQPDVWVPDSSLWVARAGDAPLDAVGSMASSPVVLATSRDAVDSLGWTDSAPGWGHALAGQQALAVPDLVTSAEGLAALSAVRTALGCGEDADNAVVQAVLAARRGTAFSVADALTAGKTGGADAPLAPVSEQEVYATNQGAEDSRLVAVYPSEGSPRLDYPVVRVGSPSGDEAAAANAVVRALISESALTAVLEAGFRGPDGTAPKGAGAATGIQEAAPRLSSWTRPPSRGSSRDCRDSPRRPGSSPSSTCRRPWRRRPAAAPEPPWPATRPSPPSPWCRATTRSACGCSPTTSTAMRTGASWSRPASWTPTREAARSVTSSTSSSTASRADSLAAARGCTTRPWPPSARPVRTTTRPRSTASWSSPTGPTRTTTRASGSRRSWTPCAARRTPSGRSR